MEALRQRVLKANLDLVKHNLVTFTWGNVSEITPDRSRFVIKPSGVEYSSLRAADLVTVDMHGNVVEGALRPSSDTPTHLALYQAFPQIGAIVHTHSRWATIWAQMKRDIPCLGTTHADTFGGCIPCTPPLTEAQIEGRYEYETGRAIAACFAARGLDPAEVPAVIVASHGPFVWGGSAAEAVHNAVVAEEVAMMAWHTVMAGADEPISSALLLRHFLRKHGAAAYYGQR